MKFVELTSAEYACFVEESNKRCFVNGNASYELYKKRNFDTYLVGVKEEDTIVCACMLVKMPVMRKFHYLYAVRGPLVDDHRLDVLEVFTNGLKEYAKNKGAIFVVSDPNVVYQVRDSQGQIVDDEKQDMVIRNMETCGFKHKGLSVGYGHNMQWFRFMYVMHIEGRNESSLMKEFGSRAKRSIKKGLKLGVEVRELQQDELNLFYDILSHTCERNEFENRSFAYYQMKKECYQDKCKVLYAYLDLPKIIHDIEDDIMNMHKQLADIAKQEEKQNTTRFEKKKKELLDTISSENDRLMEMHQLQQEKGDVIPLASSLFVIDHDEVVYEIGGSYADYYKYCAQYLVQWEMMKQAMDIGLKRYNFLGVSGDFTGEDGVLAFKQNFPGVVEEMVGDFELPVNPLLYSLYKLYVKIRGHE